MPPSIAEFVARVVETQLLSSAEIDAFLALYPEESRPADSEQLARELVRRRKLTGFQAQAIYQGKGKSLVMGNYVILDKLGQGGMGMVLKARHKRMDRLVALKVLSPAVTKTPEAVRRFQREVKAAAKLTHPNIVVAHDADEANGTHFLVMEYVEGIDLSALLRTSGALPVEQALDYVLQTAKGLQFAHNKGVVHRDIKPANLLLDQEGTIKILDMGLARLDSAGAEQDDLTGSGQMMGTVDFMAPEQALDTKHADARADIYSLGATLWYLLAGRAMYEAETTVKRIMAHQTRAIPSLREACPGVSAELEAVFVRMVTKTPDDRIQTMGEVIAALETCRVPPPTGSRPSAPAAGDAQLDAFFRGMAANPSATPHRTAGGAALATKIAHQASVPSEASEATYTPDQANERTLGKNPVENSVGNALRGVPRPGKSRFLAIPGTPRRAFRTALIVAAGLGTLAVIVLAAAGIYLAVKTPVGTIIVEIDQPELAGATVSVDGKQKITIETPDKQPPITVEADKKEHTLKVTKGGFETFTKTFTVKSGQSQTIRVRLEPEKQMAADHPATDTTIDFAAERKAAEWVLSIGGRGNLIDTKTGSQVPFDKAHPLPSHTLCATGGGCAIQDGARRRPRSVDRLPAARIFGSCRMPDQWIRFETSGTGPHARASGPE